VPKLTKQIARPIKRTESVIDRIGPISFEDVGIKIAIYGKGKTGKTTLWSSFPKPILAILCSGGKKPGELRSINTPENRKVIKQVPLRATEEIFELADYVASGNSPYKTVTLDHASGLQDLFLREILGVVKLPEQLSWGLVTQQQYGQLALKMKDALRRLLDLDGDTVIVAQERNFGEDNDNSELRLMPYVAAALSPSVTGWLNPAVDYNCQTFIRQKMETKISKLGNKEVKRQVVSDGVEYCLRTGPHPIYTTGFRVPKGYPLPDVIVDPTYDKIMKIINGTGGS
jgi:hypothetical protein